MQGYDRIYLDSLTCSLYVPVRHWPYRLQVTPTCLNDSTRLQNTKTLDPLGKQAGKLNVMGGIKRTTDGNAGG